MNQENTENSSAECLLNGCLFFSSAKLARALNKMAEDTFQAVGLAPSYALLLYLVNERSGIQPKEIGELLHLTPSTITRFLEKLENKNLILREANGKKVSVHSTETGRKLQSEIKQSWEELHNTMTSVLDPDETKQFLALSSKLLCALENR